MNWKNIHFIKNYKIFFSTFDNFQANIDKIKGMVTTPLLLLDIAKYTMIGKIYIIIIIIFLIIALLLLLLLLNYFYNYYYFYYYY